MKINLYKADSRGKADYGWLKTNYTFSFGRYYNPDRMGFGALRVINDDIVAPGKGFDTHPHDNMEIITIPLEGDLAHKDSMGNSSVIKEGEIQVMSAGSGIYHSEYNPNDDKEVKLFQIWVIPVIQNVEPRYEQIKISDFAKKDELFQILSPNPDDEGVWIHQKAWFHMGDFSEGHKETYKLKSKSNGVFVMVIKGNVLIENNELFDKDALSIEGTEQFEIISNSKSKVLVIEVPV